MTARLWLHAVRTAKPVQIRGRLTRPLRRRRFPQGPARSLRPLHEDAELWRSDAFQPLGVAPEPGSRLAAFHESYGEEVLERARAGHDAAAVVAAWVAAHPPRNDDAWHPYVASTRAANWLAAATLDPAVAAVAADGLRRSLARVAANIENDILGNHVIRNAKALVLGGVAFGDRELRMRGTRLLRRELPQQVLPDGGHYERSPVYHRVVLRDLLEIRPYVDVEDEVVRMMRFASASSRPDGAPWLFNDGGLDLAPRLGLPEPPPGTTVFGDTGYVFVNDGDVALAFDCGAPSPTFLPAHAHADALSFQLWWKHRPVVADPGSSTYEVGPTRDVERSTRAHSTVAVGGGDQFELWGAFRSGPLPDVRLEEVAAGRLSARVTWPGGATHTRSIEWAATRVTVSDVVEPSPEGTTSSLPLPVQPARDIAIEVPSGLEPRRISAHVSERFGERVPSETLVLDGAAGWSLSLGG